MGWSRANQGASVGTFVFRSGFFSGDDLQLNLGWISPPDNSIALLQAGSKDAEHLVSISPEGLEGVHHYAVNVTPKIVNPKSFEEIWSTSADGVDFDLRFGWKRRVSSLFYMFGSYPPVTPKQEQSTYMRGAPFVGNHSLGLYGPEYAKHGTLLVYMPCFVSFYAMSQI